MSPARSSASSRSRGSGRGGPSAEEALASARSDPKPCYLVTGDDPTLVGELVGRLLDALVAEGDRTMILEEHASVLGEDFDVMRLVDALCTPPFLAARRVVLVRDAGRLSAAEGERIASSLDAMASGVVLVLGSGGGTLPQSLTKAVNKLGLVLDTSVGTGRAKGEWFASRLRDARVHLDAQAGALLERHLGDEAGRLPSIMHMLEAAYGEGAKVGVAELEPFLGEAGSVPAWALTDAIDSGDPATAIGVLRRLLGPAGVSPRGVLGILHRHYQTMLRLDGLEARSAQEAASAIGARSVYPVKKAMEQGRRLGPARLGRAVVLLADADLDLNGRSALDPETVLEILIARLSRLGATRASSAARLARR